MNGQQQLEAVWIASAGGALAVAEEVTLSNPDLLLLLLWGHDQEGPTWIRDGRLWCSGGFFFDIGLVSYSWVSLGTVSLAFCGEESASSSSEIGWFFIYFSCEGYTTADPAAGRCPVVVSTTGADNTPISPAYVDVDGLLPARIDNVNPGPP